MGTVRILVSVAILLLSLKVVVSAQSLAEVARQEEERRKSIRKPSKVYTNEDLRRDSRAGTPTTVSAPAASTPSSGPSSTSSSSTPAADGSAESSGAAPDSRTPADTSTQEVKDQSYWKGRITQAREQLERTKTLAAAMQSRINALNTDFVNTDDPAKRSGVERDRQRALAELERLKKEEKDLTKSIADIGEEARRANVPPGWLR
jgi:hypothetical protein